MLDTRGRTVVWSEFNTAERAGDPDRLCAWVGAYRDGGEIPEADMEALRDVIWKHMVIIPWRHGDVVAIDNYAVSHGRLPYQGTREVAVCWA